MPNKFKSDHPRIKPSIQAGVNSNGNVAMRVAGNPAQVTAMLKAVRDKYGDDATVAEVCRDMGRQ